MSGVAGVLGKHRPAAAVARQPHPRMLRQTTRHTQGAGPSLGSGVLPLEAAEAPTSGRLRQLGANVETNTRVLITAGSEGAQKARINRRHAVRSTASIPRRAKVRYLRLPVRRGQHGDRKERWPRWELVGHRWADPDGHRPWPGVRGSCTSWHSGGPADRRASTDDPWRVVDPHPPHRAAQRGRCGVRRMWQIRVVATRRPRGSTCDRFRRIGDSSRARCGRAGECRRCTASWIST